MLKEIKAMARIYDEVKGERDEALSGLKKLRAKVSDANVPLQIKHLRSIAARCENDVRSYDLLHDIWKVMSALEHLKEPVKS